MLRCWRSCRSWCSLQHACSSPRKPRLQHSSSNGRGSRAPCRHRLRRPARPLPTGEEVSENDVVRVDTQLITVPVVVRDQEGRPVTGLTASAFQLYEDDLPQRVATFATSDAPFEVALLLDTSGSTRAGIALIRSAAYAFIESLRPGDRVAVISFNTAEEGRPKLATVGVQSYLTDDREALRRAVQNIGASNGTPYYDALECVVKDIFRDPPQPELRGRRALVALTDGVDSASVSSFASVRARLLQVGLLAYFVQVDTEDYVEDRLLADCQDDRTLRLVARAARTLPPHLRSPCRDAPITPTSAAWGRSSAWRSVVRSISSHVRRWTNWRATPAAEPSRRPTCTPPAPPLQRSPPRSAASTASATTPQTRRVTAASVRFASTCVG